jgi:hypothetical protein
MKKLFPFLMLIYCVSAIADTTAPLAPRVSVFSTTVDWAAVTGLTLNQYTGKITGKNKSLIKDGLVLYYLDSFPCYGEADSVRVWLSPNGKMVGNLRIVCVYKPKYISFAWRNATEDANQARTTGILTCPVNGDRYFTIDISECERGKDWTEMK